MFDEKDIKDNLYDLIDLYEKITDIKNDMIVRPPSTQSTLEFVAKEIWEEIGNLQRLTNIEVLVKKEEE